MRFAGSRKNKRKERITVFAFGEGESEEIFLKHLRAQFTQGKTQVRVENAGGKGPVAIVEQAARHRAGNAYHHSFVLMDTVPVWQQNVIALAKKHGFELLGSSPCIEALFLEILNHPKPNTPDKCKKCFQRKYLRDGRRIITLKDCEYLFTITVLSRAREKVSTLERIIQIFEGDF